jgi:murein DD-endopeptidase MepM/ murein hydrolase activator NlpD
MRFMLRSSRTILQDYKGTSSLAQDSRRLAFAKKVRLASRLCVALVATLSLLNCGGGLPSSPNVRETCSGYPPWETSDYVLPYPVGTAYQVHQGNCSGFGHSGFWKYSYDFTMPIGTTVTAARGGQVLYEAGGAHDGETALTNLVTIQHEDGSVAVYSHLTFHGPLVVAGQMVNAGDPVGKSGNTGNTGGFPHLHFSVHPCGKLPGLPGGDDFSCPSIPVTFKNTNPNPEGLLQGSIYPALPYP